MKNAAYYRLIKFLVKHPKFNKDDYDHHWERLVSAYLDYFQTEFDEALNCHIYYGHSFEVISLKDHFSETMKGYIRNKDYVCNSMKAPLQYTDFPFDENQFYYLLAQVIWMHYKSLGFRIDSFGILELASFWVVLD